MAKRDKNQSSSSVLRAACRRLQNMIERMAGDAIRTEYSLIKRARRSLPQHRLCWQTLTAVVAATGMGRRQNICTTT